MQMKSIILKAVWLGGYVLMMVRTHASWCLCPCTWMDGTLADCVCVCWRAKRRRKTSSHPTQISANAAICAHAKVLTTTTNTTTTARHTSTRQRVACTRERRCPHVCALAMRLCYLTSLWAGFPHRKPNCVYSV